MQIVIDIDEDTYRYMQSRCKYQNKGDKGLSKFEMAGVAIKNGTPLPKGHGDLIDRNSILCDDCSCEQCGHTDECFKLLAPTIIKENKTEVE